jgi:hypothetical protein
MQAHVCRCLHFAHHILRAGHAISHPPAVVHFKRASFVFAFCVQVKYRGSAEERADLLQLVNRFRGDMRSVFDWLMLSRPELDSHRFRDTLEEAVAAGAQRRCQCLLRAVRVWMACVVSAVCGLSQV